MTRGLVALIFVMMVIIIIFLVFQVYDNSNKCKDVRIAQQDQMKDAARLIVQSATQNHPLFAYNYAIQSKLKIDNIIDAHGGISTAERNLKIPKGRLENLRKEVYERYQDIEALMMEGILKKYPELDLEINDEAGLRKKHKSSSSKSSSSHRKKKSH